MLNLNENNLKVKVWNNEKILIIESGRLDIYLDFINSNLFLPYKGIVVCKALGYHLDEIKFIYEVPHVKYVAIADYFSDLSPLYSLVELKRLDLSDKRQKIDLSYFKKIEELSFDWGKNIKNLDQCDKLKKIIIGGFNPKSKNFHEFHRFDELEEMIIIRANICDLKGINRYKKLKKIEFSYMRNLERIEGIDQESIEYLEFDSCKRIVDHDSVRRLKSLEVLKFNRCGKIKSINFIRELKKLKVFTFVDTEVIDGDLTPCLHLDYVGFFNKKHYSHTDKEIDEITRKNRLSNPQNIPIASANHPCNINDGHSL